MPIENDENKNEIDDHEEATTGMEEVDAFDFERAVMLMSVMEKVANVAPKSSAISGLAAAALNEMNEEAKLIAKRRAVEVAKLEAAVAAARANAQRESEAEAKAEAEEATRVADDAARAPQPARAIPSNTQAHAPAGSKTDQVARDNMRRA